MDAISAVAGLMTARTQNSIETAVMRQQIKADNLVLDMIASATQAPPAPGTGLVVDKRA